MGIVAKTTEIGGVTYEITLLGGRKGFEILTVLPKFLGGAIGALIATDGTKLDPMVMLTACREVGEHLASPEFQKIVFALLDTARANNLPLKSGPGGMAWATFDDHFAGNYGSLAQLIVFVLQENFGSFFAAKNGFDVIAERLLRLAGPSTAHLTSTSGSPSSSRAA